MTQPFDSPIIVRELHSNVASFCAVWFQEWLFVLMLLGINGYAITSVNATPRIDDMEVYDLRVEYRDNPLGIDISVPRFSWKLRGAQRGLSQTAYQILVASSTQRLETNNIDVWDSGVRRSNNTVNIDYRGGALRSGTHYYWKVRVWDSKNNSSNWSATRYWSMGKLTPGEWQAEWIGHRTGYFVGDKYHELYLPPSPYLRSEFLTKKTVPIKRAMLYVTALGLYEIWLNGARVSNHFFTPGWTDYDKRLYYQTYDVTENLASAENAIGAILADGWYAGYIGYGLFVKLPRVREFYGEEPAFLAQLDIEYVDGSKQVVKTDETWRAKTGPILEADILMGETYDARLELGEWSQPNFDDSDWSLASWHAGTRGALQAYPGVAVKELEKLTPVAITKVDSNRYIFDLGKNISGYVMLRARANAGTRITFRFGELLNPDGSLMVENLRKARATDTYIFKGDEKEEIWKPRFTYHGFQFVEVSGLPDEPDADTITGIRLNSDTPEVGFITVDSDIDFGGKTGMVSQLFENIRTTQFANFFEVPTDCPQRDERLGWTGDAQVYARSATMVADVSAFYTKWLIDLDDAQQWYGAYPHFAPFPYTRKHRHSPGWMDAGVIIPHEMYRTYADTRILERMWPGMQKFMAFQLDEAGEDLLRPATGQNFGDWLALDGETSRDLIAQVYFGHDTVLMAEMAEALGKYDEARKYQALAAQIKKAFANEYIDERGRIESDTQTAYAMSLGLGMVPAELENLAVERLVNLVKRQGSKLATGFLGVRHLLPVLSEYGYGTLAEKLFLEKEFPSWGFEIVNGATSIWERWDGYTKRNGFNKQMNSFSHYAFGSVAEWMFSIMGGIQPHTSGYEDIQVKPQLLEGINGVRTHYDSIRGPIETYWKKGNKLSFLEVTIPGNTTALVHILTTNANSVRENGQKIAAIPEIQFVEQSTNYAVYRIGSGEYKFSFRNE